ncbi:MAG: hypothetical protein DMG06_22260 [Acidobacteria bacterium]|nr:MAG: hypothetical protein DMG06_22260 [Acidobacteriota bacterium]
MDRAATVRERLTQSAGPSLTGGTPILAIFVGVPNVTGGRGTKHEMSDSPLKKGAKAPRALGVVLLVSGRVGTGQPPEAFGFFPPLLRGIFEGATGIQEES